MHITEVQIMPIKASDGLVALASIVFNHCLYLGSIGVYTRRNAPGYRITYPTKSSDGKSFNIYHPINREVSAAIELAVLRQAATVLETLTYQTQKSNEYDRHSHPLNS